MDTGSNATRASAAVRRDDAPRVLLIDDEHDLYATLCPRLENAGFAVAWAQTGEQGIDLFRAWHPNVILLDLVLPGIGGLEVCRRIRETSPIPIVIYSILADREIMREAFEAGAFDYVVKGPESDDLLVRVRSAVLHWSAAAEEVDTAKKLARFGIAVDRAHGWIIVNDRVISLTPKEYEVLRYLALHPGAVITYGTLLSAIWGTEYEGATASLRIFMSNLRRKIELDPSRPRLIVSMADVGYSLQPCP
jgi:two-component system, OmpR family, KDP operon response regulator KdpE